VSNPELDGVVEISRQLVNPFSLVHVVPIIIFSPRTPEVGEHILAFRRF
jgi:hypothetical protein